MQKSIPNLKTSLFDLVVLAGLAAIVGASISFIKQCSGAYCPNYAIELSLAELPFYMLCSSLRGLAAFFLSLLFTLVIGYKAAKSPLAEKIILPLLDICQSIPVLGFLPGLVLGLVALFPKTNLGLELACILMIFTGQVWNMTFSFYASIKSIPTDLKEAASVIGLTPWGKFKRLELPYSAMNLAWNCVLSMSGGWFFLCVCEAFSLANVDYRLPGVGAYMALAIEQNNVQAMMEAILAMAILILLMDFCLWRPLLSFAYRFRLEQQPSTVHVSNHAKWLNYIYNRSRIIHFIIAAFQNRSTRQFSSKRSVFFFLQSPLDALSKLYLPFKKIFFLLTKAVFYLSIFAGILLVAFELTFVFQNLLRVNGQEWLTLLGALGFTFLRILGCLLLSTLWTVPVGIWIGTSPKIINQAQSIIQLLASFPAPMLYPLVLGLLFSFGLDLSISSMFLMMLGVQWYILFNVIAGTLHIPLELQLASKWMHLGRYSLWKNLYLPSIFPSVVTGWLTAAGGAWNASIIAEYLEYKGSVQSTLGIGSIINLAASNANFPLLTASLCLVILVVTFLNRTLWAKLFQLAQNRYRTDL